MYLSEASYGLSYNFYALSSTQHKTPLGGRVFRKPAPGGVLHEAVRCAILMQMFYGGYA